LRRSPFSALPPFDAVCHEKDIDQIKKILGWSGRAVQLTQLRQPLKQAGALSTTPFAVRIPAGLADIIYDLIDERLEAGQFVWLKRFKRGETLESAAEDWVGDGHVRLADFKPRTALADHTGARLI
jgi:hypothetical protein